MRKLGQVGEFHRTEVAARAGASGVPGARPGLSAAARAGLSAIVPNTTMSSASRRARKALGS
jgi:hypothetical protein